MKIFTAFFFTILTSLVTFGQSDPVESFRLRKFPCDTSVATLNITFCAGEKYHYVDSLLNDTYRKVLKSIDKDIIDDKNALKAIQSKKDSATVHEEKRYYLNEIVKKKRLKQSIIESQNIWIQTRDLNSQVIRNGCEGGQECNAIVSLSEIDDILERIKKLQSFYYIED